MKTSLVYNSICLCLTLLQMKDLKIASTCLLSIDSHQDKGEHFSEIIRPVANIHKIQPLANIQMNICQEILGDAAGIYARTFQWKI